MKKWLVVLALLASCAKREAPQPSQQPVTKPPMKVGLLTPGSVNDNGWNAIAAGYGALFRGAIFDPGRAVSYTHLTLPTICSV